MQGAEHDNNDNDVTHYLNGCPSIDESATPTRERRSQNRASSEYGNVFAEQQQREFQLNKSSSSSVDPPYASLPVRMDDEQGAVDLRATSKSNSGSRSASRDKRNVNSAPPSANGNSSRSASKQQHTPRSNVIYDRAIMLPEDERKALKTSQYAMAKVKRPGYDSLDGMPVDDGATIVDQRPGFTMIGESPMDLTVVELSDVSLESSGNSEELVHRKKPLLPGAGRNQYESTASKLTLSPAQLGATNAQ